MSTPIFTVPPFIPLALRERLRPPPPIAQAMAEIDALLEKAAAALNAGGHFCTLGHGQPLKSALIACLKRLCLLTSPERRAHHNRLDALSEDILAARLSDLLEQEGPLSLEDECLTDFVIQKRYLAGFQTVLQVWKRLWAARQAEYHPENNAQYPIRDSQGTPLTILRTDPWDAIRRTYNRDAILPFIDPTLTHAERAALYEDLACIPFTRDHMQHAQEEALLGQYTVITRKAFEKGVCLGVYAGILLTEEERAEALPIHNNHRFIQASAEVDGKLPLDGDAILSKINTIFEYDPTSPHPTRQAKSGYNVAYVPFRVTITAAHVILLYTIFTVAPIEAGVELRVDYKYSDGCGLIGKIFEA